MRKNIAVVGSYDASPEEVALARALGEALAPLECHIVCGGRQGVMDAVSEGFRRARDEEGRGGVIVGILPEADKSAANPHLDVALPTGLGFHRNGLVALAGDAVIAVGGGAGTLSEIAFAWMHGRPVALLGRAGWAGRLAGETLDHRRGEPLPRFDDAEGVVRWLREILDLRPAPPPE